VVTLTFRNKGTVANGVDVRLNYQQGESLPAGVGIVIAQGVAGSVDPDINTAIAVIGDVHYHTVATSLADINEAFASAAAAKRPDHGRIFELDEQFHRGYMIAAGPRVLSIHATVKPQAERYERLYVSMLEAELQTSVVEHRAIVRAIRTGNAPGARAAVETNWRNAAERLAAVVAASGERGSW
jgi:DNA-binding GntR family transcriptional regulator